MIHPETDLKELSLLKKIVGSELDPQKVNRIFKRGLKSKYIFEYDNETIGIIHFNKYNEFRYEKLENIN